MLSNTDLSINEYLNKTFPCECSRTHSISINQILIGNGVLSMLPNIIRQNNLHKPFLLYDATTYKIAGEASAKHLNNSGISFDYYVLNDTEPTPDEKTIGEILIHFNPECDTLIAVGSGTINDLSRFISYKLGLPYMIAATAPSMDGFASNVAPLIVNHMKTTFEAQVPYAILGDTVILSGAPIQMISAGIGDILGKYTCLCDWEISHVITGEYHCKEIEGIVRKSIETVVNQIDHAKSRNPETVKSIIEALVLSGIAMSFAGNSRPASGSEHHLSHYWEMIYLFSGKKPVLHGTKVGIATIAVIKAYELLISRKIDFNYARRLAGQYSYEEWVVKMRDAYGLAADSVITLEAQIEKNSKNNRLERINLLEERWEELRRIALQLPSSDTIYNYLDTLGAPASPMAVGIDKSTFVDSFIAAKELRNRFGLLQILYDLGLIEEIAENVWDYFSEKA